MPQRKVTENYQKPSSFAEKSKHAPKSVILELPQPHPKQYELIYAFEIHKDKGVRFVVGACGTKFGKTYGCSIRLVKEAWENKNSLNWWVAPTYAQAKMAYSLVKRLLPTHPTKSYIEYKADLKLVLLEPDGSEHSVIEFKSGDNPDGLRGFGVNFFILDEAARIPYESFISVLTTVTQTMGRGIIISTPNGRGWFFDVYQRGEKLDEEGRPKFGPLNPDPYPEWMSIRMPTWTNPHVALKAVDEAKNNVPDDVFRQEFGAQFLDDSAGVFRNVTGCVEGTFFEDRLPGHRYVAGIDLARLRDYTVITVLDVTDGRNRVVYVERFNQIKWEVQYMKIIRVAKHYDALCCIDHTGIGDPIVETLRGGGIHIEPYKIGGSSAKQQLIDKLRVNIENRRITYPYNKWTLAMLEELRCYEYTFTESGVIKYSAPNGKHDDCVISLALANWIGDTQPFVYKCWLQKGI